MQTSLTPPSYPARPVNGGPLDRALPKSGDWFYEPKYNGWRALVHVPTGTMFNRKGQRLSIADEFQPALNHLHTTLLDNGCDARPIPFPEWVDCEALERRHNIGRGTLIVLDFPTVKSPYEKRVSLIQCFFNPIEAPGIRQPGLKPCGDNEVRSLRSWNDPGMPAVLWRQMQEDNRLLGCEFYEGLVAKRANSLYPIQLRSPDQEFPFWMKHRWAF